MEFKLKEKKYRRREIEKAKTFFPTPLPKTLSLTEVKMFLVENNTLTCSEYISFRTK